MEEKWWKGCAEILEKKNPELLQRLKDNEFSEIEFCKAKNGELNLRRKSDGQCIHSEENPSDEMTQWMKAQRKNVYGREACFLFGIGLGYAYEEIREWLWDHPQRKLIVVEDDLGIIKRFFETERGYRFLDDKQTVLIAPSSLENIGPHLHEVLNSLVPFPYRTMHIGVLCDPFYLQNREEDATAFYGRVRGQYEITVYKAEWLSFAPTVIQNAISNLYQLPHAKNIKGMLNAFEGMPAIVCGGGPSVDKQIEEIRKLEDKALIIGVGAGINVLSHYGIKPHLCCGIDPNLINFSRFLTHTAFEVPLVFSRRVNREILTSIQSPLIHMGTTEKSYFIWFEEQLGSYIREESQPIVSVGNEGVVLAKSLGCSSITLVGIDLSRREGTTYAHGVMNHPMIECSSNFADFNQMQFLRSSQTQQQSQTTMQFMQEWVWYSEYAKSHPEIKFFNASIGGLEISGVDSKPLREIVEVQMKETHDVRGVVHSSYADSKGYSLEKIHQLLNEWKEHLADATDLCRKIVEAYQASEPTEDLIEQLRENVFYIHQLRSSDAVFHFVLNMKEKYWGIEIDDEILAQKYSFLYSKCKEYQKGLEYVEARRKTRDQRDWQKFPSQKGVESIQSATQTNEIENGPEKKETHFPSGALKKVEYFKNKKLHGTQRIYGEEGEVLYESQYNEGKKEGQTVMYYASGALFAVLNYSDNKEHGEQKYFYESGAPRSVIHYKNGILDGSVLFYYPEGDLKRQQSFKNGKREKMERLWTEHTNLRYQMTWKDGNPFGEGKLWNEDGKYAAEVDFGDGSARPKVIHWDTNTDEVDQIKQMRMGMGELEGDMNKALHEFAKVDWPEEALETFEKEKVKLKEAFAQLKEITNRMKGS